jgi:ABC-type protease/lipase transport system fused ATPase/permease subunit
LVELKKRRRTILMVAHQPSTLRTADSLLVLKDGCIAAFGERDKVLGALMEQTQQQRVVSMQCQSRETLPTLRQARRKG